MSNFPLKCEYCRQDGISTYCAPSLQAYKRHLTKDHSLGLVVRPSSSGPVYTTYQLSPEVAAERVRLLRKRKGGRNKNRRLATPTSADGQTFRVNATVENSYRSSTPESFGYLPVDEMGTPSTMSTCDSEDIREILAIDANATFDSEAFEESVGLRDLWFASVTTQPSGAGEFVAEQCIPSEPEIDGRPLVYSPISSAEVGPDPDQSPTMTIKLEPLAIVTADVLMAHPEAVAAAVANVIANATSIDRPDQREQFTRTVEFAAVVARRILVTVLVRHAFRVADLDIPRDEVLRELIRDANGYNVSWTSSETN